MSLAELENVEWQQPGPGAPPTLRRCYETRKKPLADLTASDLRLLIAQDLGLQFLLPLALEVLSQTPLVEAEHYKGDLLAAVLRASPGFFRKDREAKRTLEGILERVPPLVDRLDSIDHDTTSEAIDEAIAQFRSGQT